MAKQLVLCWLVLLTAGAAPAAERPNILWITSEDNGPHLGCYGDDYADTLHIDRLAAQGLIYLNCWSNAPVCAPARTCLISGLYPPGTGSQHMRSMTKLPAGLLMFPQYLRQAGYYCTNNQKEDYNLQKPGRVWDESSGKAHWKNRQAGQPFFAVFNHTVSHESRIRRRPHTPVHDPAKVRVPAYHPDTPEVRRDWAQYYDKLTEMDAEVGRNLAELEQAGLADDTIVFYFADHGSGMPRSKRWPYNSGLNVPLVVFIPPKFRDLAPDEYKPGGSTERLVAFVDFAPTLLSLAGIEPPEHFQGRAFLGRFEAKPGPLAFGFRGRMDERYDMVRSVRDRRYVYVRNYMPHKIYGQHLWYMFQTPTTLVWKQLYDDGKLTRQQSAFWERKPPEELYDLQNDPDEVVNLAASAEHREILKRLRTAQRELALSIRDVGFLPEEEIHRRAEGTTPYEMARRPQVYPLQRIMAMAELASSLKPGVDGELMTALDDSDGAVRYWAVLGLLMRGRESVTAAQRPLRDALQDESSSVRIAAAEALGRYGDSEDAAMSLPVLLEAANVQKRGIYSATAALNAIDALDERAAPIFDALEKLPRESPAVSKRMESYVPRLLEKILKNPGDKP